MKKNVLILTTAALAVMSIGNAKAGDREWAVAGKVLTGLAAASIISHAIQPAPVYYSGGHSAPAPVYTGYAAPAYACTPQPVVYVQPAPPPVVVYRTPVYVAPAPVCYSTVRVYAPAPVVRFRFGYGGGYRCFRRSSW